MKNLLAIAALSASIPFAANAFMMIGPFPTTSVSLDFELLETAAGLVVTSVDTDGVAAEGYDVGFQITADSDFDFSDLSGSIEHSGTVTFNETVTLGEFSISLMGDVLTVSDTTGFDAPVFTLGDMSAPVMIDGYMLPDGMKVQKLILEFGELNVSADLATFLGDTSLTGADVGGAKVATYIVVPEPSTLAAIGLGVVALFFIFRRRRA
jgi:hypothetical protein